MSLFLVRLLQSFSSISLDLDAQPPESHAPEAWKGAEGRKGKDRIHPKSHLTMYSEVCLIVYSVRCVLSILIMNVRS